MSDKIHGGIKAGGTSVSIFVGPIRKSADNTEKTGLVYNTSGLTAYYCRQGGSPTAISLATLAAITSAYSSGGFKEADGSNMKGLYRLDLPDAAIATGADFVEIAVQGSDFFTWAVFVPLESSGAAEVKTDTAAIKTKTDQLVFTLTNKVDASIQAAGDFAQAAADKVWASATRTLSAFSTSLALSVWDVLASAIGTASSIGVSLKTGLTTVASLGTDVAAIKAKTDNLPSGPLKNSALRIFFSIPKASDPTLDITGVTPTTVWSKDGAAFAATTNSAVEISSGDFYLDLTAAEANCDAGRLRATATDGRTVRMTVYFEP